MSCSRNKYGACHVKNCCRLTWNYGTNRWVKNLKSCRYERLCKSKRIKCRQVKLRDNCFQRVCTKLILKFGKVQEKKRKKFFFKQTCLS